MLSGALDPAAAMRMQVDGPTDYGSFVEGDQDGKKAWTMTTTKGTATWASSKS